MKKKNVGGLLAVLMVVGVLAFGLGACTPQKAQEDAIKLGVIQYATHPSLDAALEGFLDVLGEGGYVDGERLNVVFANPEGDQPTARAIAQQFSEDGYDLILAIATPAAQAVANAIKDVPILITAVTDPVTAKLVESLEKPNTNVTGTSDYVSISEQLDLLREILPQATRLGVIYNNGEENSVVQVEEVMEYVNANSMTLVEATPTNSSEVLQAAQSLVGKVDAVYIPSDNTVVSAFEAVLKVCEEERIPLIPAEGESVARGGVATAGVNYYKLGEITGRQALSIIEGVKPQDIPLETQEEAGVIVNLKAARKIGIEIPESVLEKAVQVITE